MDKLCDKHGLPKVGLCSWCGKSVCEECVTEAYEKNYCFNCLARLPLDKLGSINDSIAQRGSRNVDATLSQKDIAEKRKYVEMKISNNKELFQGIKNIDKETQDVEQARKKFQEYMKKKEKYGL